MVWWLTAAAHGAIVLKSGTLCVELQPSFANAIGEDGVAGAARPAHGLRFQITDALATYEGYLLAETGCVDDYPVFAEALGGMITLRVSTVARLGEVTMESWIGADHLGPRSFVAADFRISTGSRTTFSSTSKVVGDDQRWRNLSIATVLFQENDRNTALFGPIHLQADPTAEAGTCCRSALRDTDNILGNEPPGLYTGTDAPIRSRLARSIRQVLSRLRADLTHTWSCRRSRLSWWVGGAGFRQCP